jgi:hypothetical protein
MQFRTLIVAGQISLAAGVASQLGFTASDAAEASASTKATRAADKTESEADLRLAWNLKTLVSDYEEHGRRSPKWDGPAKAALGQFAQIRAFGASTNVLTLAANMKSVLTLAISNGCDDPLVLYLRARYSSESGRITDQADEFRIVAEGLSRGEYSSIRKFYAALRTSEALDTRSSMPAKQAEEIQHWRHEAAHFLADAVKDKSMPVGEVFDGCVDLLESVQRTPELTVFYQALEPILSANWPSQSFVYLLRGIYYTHYAWQGRSTAFGDKVTDEQWTLFEERLVAAETALNRAWELNPRDPRIACRMITVELGQGQGRPRMEMWFKRATDLDPNYPPAFSAKLYYLEPKWYGSPQDMIEFGRECVASTKWGGRAPLILCDAYETIVRTYVPLNQRPLFWKDSKVWSDIESAIEKYAALNPQDNTWHEAYALYAYRAERWDELNRQLPLQGPIHYERFNGRDAYDKMLRLAKQHGRVKLSAAGE